MAVGELPMMLPSAPTGAGVLSNLPTPSGNLFQRIIRNPRPDSPHARERECTEMLASVIINAPLLRQHLFRWFLRQTGSASDIVDDLEFQIDTEQGIGAKRDDLRIEGRRSRLHDDHPALLWSVEVKVGSSFHRSAAQHIGEDGKVPKEFVGNEVDEELVHQLKHYDDWLCVEHAKHGHQHCQGFVLALHDLTQELVPLKLKRTWTCLSWTRLGLEVKAALEVGDLPKDEALLAKHLLGFISQNLWRQEEMPDDQPKLDFNDIAMIRAFSKIGRTCEKKVNALVQSVTPIFEGAIGGEKANRYEYLYKSDACSCLDAHIVPGLTKDADPILNVSLGCEDAYDDYMGVFIVMSPRHPQREAVQKALSPIVTNLQARNPSWREGSGVNDDWSVLELVTPLTVLLAAEDQEKALGEFVRKGLCDLKECGALDAVRDVFDATRAGKRPLSSKKR